MSFVARDLCAIKALEVRERRQCSSIEGSHLGSGLCVGKLLSGELKGCHMEGAESTSFVIQRTEVRPMGVSRTLI